MSALMEQQENTVQGIKLFYKMGENESPKLIDIVPARPVQRQKRSGNTDSTKDRLGIWSSA